jgi:hypothetical protein
VREMAEIGTCILDVLNKMDSEEKGMLKCILDFGKNIQKKDLK